MKTFPFWDPHVVMGYVEEAMLDAAVEQGMWLAKQLTEEQAHEVAEEIRASDWYKNTEYNEEEGNNPDLPLDQYQKDTILITEWSVDAAKRNDGDKNIFPDKES